MFGVEVDLRIREYRREKCFNLCKFIELEKLEDVNAQKKVVVEAYLLFLILGLRDLNEGNTGLNQEKNMCIFDFMIADIEVYLRSQMLNDYKNKNILQNIRKASTILTGIGAEERMQIAEDALPRWDRINSMTRNVIDSELNELRKHGIELKTTSNDIDSYLHDVKLNYISLCSAFQKL
ncbi:unnamed protein product [Auanema sp. JU1783]|nr:unnamed protein product [Auanema sp. JU1783]